MSVGALASYAYDIMRAHETIIRPGDTRDTRTVAMYVTADGSVGIATCWASFAQWMTWQP